MYSPVVRARGAFLANSPDSIFVKRHSGAPGYHDEVFHDGAQASSVFQVAMRLRS